MVVFNIFSSITFLFTCIKARIKEFISMTMLVSQKHKQSTSNALNVELKPNISYTSKTRDIGLTTLFLVSLVESIANVKKNSIVGGHICQCA